MELERHAAAHHEEVEILGRAGDAVDGQRPASDEGGGNALRLEVARDGIHVQMFYPALTETDFPRNALIPSPRSHSGRTRPTPASEVARTLHINVGQVYLAKHRVGRLLKKEVVSLQQGPR